MVIILVMESAAKLNWFPPKNGVSQAYSPRMLLHRRKLDYQKHCSIPMFSFVQAHDDPDHKSNQAPRTLDCLYLRPNPNEQGGHLLLHLATNAYITRHKVTVVPLTSAVIDMVDAIAKFEGMPKGLKVTTKFGNVLYDSAWTAGVYTDTDQRETPSDDIADIDSDHEDDEETGHDQGATPRETEDTVPAQSTSEGEEEATDEEATDPEDDIEFEVEEEQDPEDDSVVHPTEFEEEEEEPHSALAGEEEQPPPRRSARENIEVAKSRYEHTMTVKSLEL
jgi:hypothetical protein